MKNPAVVNVAKIASRNNAMMIFMRVDYRGSFARARGVDPCRD